MKKAKRYIVDKANFAIPLIFLLAVGLVWGGYNVVSVWSQAISTDIASQISHKDEPIDTPPLVVNVNIEDTPAYEFVRQVSFHTPGGYDAPLVKDNGTSTTFVTWICGNINISPAPIVGNYASLNRGASVIVQAYGAGQTPISLDNYRKGASSCANRNGKAYLLQDSAPGTDASGFTMQIRSEVNNIFASVWTRGDAVISVSAPDRNQLRELVADYDAVAQQVLQNTGCLSVEVTPQDSTRSPYYNHAAYTGWQRGREVKIDVTTPTIGVGNLDSSLSVQSPGRRLGVLDSQAVPLSEAENLDVSNIQDIPSAPEGPLPEGFPATLPKSVEQPPQVYPGAPQQPSLTSSVPERVEDKDGPGCGWAWSGQGAPLFDATEEKKAADERAAIRHEEIRANFASYVVEDSKWYNGYLDYTKKVNKWNSYAASVQDILDQWNWLNGVRADYRSRLDAYYAAIDDRNSFITRQQEAQKEYDALVQDCTTAISEWEKSFAAWEEQYDNVEAPNAPSDTDEETSVSPEPTPEPTIPPAPERPQCEPDRPSILDQAIPAEPSPPAKPDVPLPASWTDVP